MAVQVLGTGDVLNVAFLCLSYMLLTKLAGISGFFERTSHTFQLVDPSTQLSSVPTPAPTSRKQEKKQLRSKQLMKSSTYNIMLSEFQQRSLGRLEFYDDFNAVMFFVVLVIAVSVEVILVQQVLGVGKAHLPLNLAVALVLYTLYSTYQVEWAHEIIKSQDKWGMAAFGLMGAGLAACLLSFAPPSAVGFDAAAAARQLVQHGAQVMQDRFPHMPAGILAAFTPDTIRAVLVTIVTCLAGFISGLLLAPGLRFGRLVLQALFPPSWSRDYIVYSTWERLLLRAAVAVPFAVAASWVTPLTNVLSVPPAWLPTMRLLVVSAGATLYVAMLQPLVQSFLYTAMLKWYLVRHSAVPMDEATRGALLERNFFATNAQTCKVAMQMAVMPCLLVAAATMLALNSFQVGSTDGQLGQLLQVWQLLAGFVAWWSCLWWCLYGMLSVVFVRLGVLGTNTGV